MNVEKIDLGHQPLVNRHFAALKTNISDFTFANVFLFRDIYRYRLVRNGNHHEIYLGDPRRGDPAKLKTVLRQPVKKG